MSSNLKANLLTLLTSGKSKILSQITLDQVKAVGLVLNDLNSLAQLDLPEPIVSKLMVIFQLFLKVMVNFLLLPEA